MSGMAGVGSRLVTGGCEDRGEVGPPRLQPVISFPACGHMQQGQAP